MNAALRWVAALGCVGVYLSLLTGPVASALGDEIEKGNFRISYDERGITGLANPDDPFDAQMLARGQRLGLLVKYRIGDAEWQDLSSDVSEIVASPDKHLVTLTSGATNDPLQVIQTFRTDGASLDWNIELEVTTNATVEIGDLAINIPVTGPHGENPKQIFEHGFLRHQFISGYGSFLYFVRASGAPPFLMVTVRPGTKLEYFAGGRGRGGARVFVHSGLSGGNEKRGTWRQRHTFLTLARERDSQWPTRATV